MNKKCLLLLIIGTVLFSFNLFGQTKYEREYKVKRQEIPLNAIGFIDSAFVDCKVKWYIEQSQEGKSFEAKTKFNQSKFSIEFDTMGVVLDVEKTVKFKTLDSSLQEKINKSLQKKFVFYKIVKTQIQWKAPDNTLQELIINGESQSDYTLRYELILKAKKDGIKKFYEVLLDSNGSVMSISEIVQRSTNNLDF